MKTDTIFNQLSKNNVTDIDFLKIDAEGCEVPILRGTGSYLKRCFGIEIEVIFADMRINIPKFADIDILLKENDFDLFDIQRFYWKRNEENI